MCEGERREEEAAAMEGPHHSKSPFSVPVLHHSSSLIHPTLQLGITARCIFFFSLWFFLHISRDTLRTDPHSESSTVAGWPQDSGMVRLSRFCVEILL